MSKENRSTQINTKEYEQQISNYCNEYERQIATSLKLGYHKVLGMTLEAYLSSLPYFEPPPKNFEDRFDKILLVESRIPAWLQLKIAGYKYCINGEINNQPNTEKRMPYITWVQDGGNKELREINLSDERSLTVQEGASLLIARPEIVKNHPVALLGSSVIFKYDDPQKRTPCIYQWSDGLIGMGADNIRHLEDDGARPATCSWTT